MELLYYFLCGNISHCLSSHLMQESIICVYYHNSNNNVTAASLAVYRSYVSSYRHNCKAIDLLKLVDGKIDIKSDIKYYEERNAKINPIITKYECALFLPINKAIAANSEALRGKGARK